MKKKSINIKDYFLLIYLFFYIFQIIKAEITEDECTRGCKLVDKKCTHNSDYLETCGAYCVPDLVEGKCYNCRSNLNSTIYYIFRVDSGYNHVCQLGGYCGGNKLVFNTRQCVKECSGQGTNDLYIMDGVCYTKEECEERNRIRFDNFTCDCRYLYSITEILYRNKILRHCYDNGELCGPEHTMYDSDTRICGAGDCEPGKVKKIETRAGQSNIVRCSTQCKSNEVEYNGYCLEKCPPNKYKYYDGNGTSHCTSSCSSVGLPYILEGNICSATCPSNFYIFKNNSCLRNCILPYYYSEWSVKYCSLGCIDGRDYYQEYSNRCVDFCRNYDYHYIHYTISGKRFYICTTETCYMHYDEDWNRQCYTSCAASGYPYYYSSSKTLCRPNCANAYHNEGEYQCLTSCGPYTYEKDRVCYCYLFAIEVVGGVQKKVCYKDEKECNEKGYNYRKGNECIKVCNPYFEVINYDNTNYYLKRCYDSIEECQSNGYYFYNTYKLKCWSTCPYEMWSIELNNEGKPKEDITRSTCVDKCGKDYPKYTDRTKVCKKECDNGEYYMLDDPNKCIGNCPYDYVGEDNECLEKCENKKYYFPMGNGKNKCVKSCKNYGKFYVEDDPKCYDSCASKSLFYYYNSDHKCVSSCLKTADQFYYGKMSVPQSCKNTNENNYYYENKTLVASCPLVAEKGSFLCVESCGSKKIYENYCVDSCPAETPYFKRSGDSDVCVNTCGNNNYVVLFRNECIGTSCPEGYSQNITGKYCYPNCKFGEKFNIDSGSCVSTCPAGLL